MVTDACNRLPVCIELMFSLMKNHIFSQLCNVCLIKPGFVTDLESGTGVLSFSSFK